MVATWNPAAASTYYTRQRETEYYAGSEEPVGVWYAPAGDFGLVDGSAVDRKTFERLYDADRREWPGRCSNKFAATRSAHLPSM